ncbi:MAG: recombinase family protein [Bacteriovoracaceae bacterium]|nr:recombinase family protein [Bacteriovoracaceae bacterium]
MKAAIYSRVSTDKQQTGLESQRRALEEYCRLKGIADYEVFEDFATSGSLNSRPQLDLMMAKVRSKEINLVIVHSFSRFARSTSFLINSLEEFGCLGCGFVSITENIDLSTPIGKAVFTIISAIAALERDLVRLRVLTGLENARANGKQLGRPRKLQYDLIVTLKAEGYTHREISKMLGIGNGSVGRALKKSGPKIPDTEH